MFLNAVNGHARCATYAGLPPRVSWLLTLFAYAVVAYTGRTERLVVTSPTHPVY